MNREGLSSSQGTRASVRRWTSEEISLVRSLVDYKTNQELAQMFDVTQHQMMAMVLRRGIRRKNRYRKKEVQWRVDSVTGCWNCFSHTLVRGYPRLKRNGRLMLVARYFYEQKYGSVPKGLLIRHKCDNRACVNPDHLEVGTYQDNSSDAVRRRRNCRKLSEEIVEEIGRLLSLGELTNTEIARRYGVNQSVISRIKRRKVWKHVWEVK